MKWDWGDTLFLISMLALLAAAGLGFKAILAAWF
jgi:hypothetical protein